LPGEALAKSGAEPQAVIQRNPMSTCHPNDPQAWYAGQNAPTAFCLSCDSSLTSIMHPVNIHSKQPVPAVAWERRSQRVNVLDGKHISGYIPFVQYMFDTKGTE
jgi:hypothetical protein